MKLLQLSLFNSHKMLAFVDGKYKSSYINLQSGGSELQALLLFLICCFLSASQTSLQPFTTAVPESNPPSTLSFSLM